MTSLPVDALDLIRSIQLGSALRARGVGQVLLPDDADYPAVLAGFNLDIVHRPDVVVVATSADDVRHAVQVAADHTSPVTVIGRGHGFAHGIDGGVAIVTRFLAAVTVDAGARTATVTAGTPWSDVMAAATPFGLAPLAGSSPLVGVVGYVMGGGIGPVARTFGYAADHIRSFTVVTGLGAIITATPVEHPDLFWALRGGKFGLGVVIEVTIDLFELSTLFAGGLFFAGEDAHAVLHGWAAWSQTVPESVSSSVALLRLPPLPQLPEPIRGKFVVHVRAAMVGVDDAAAEALLAPIRALGQVLLDGFGELPYAALSVIHSEPVDPMPVREGGRLLSGLPVEAVDALLAAAGPEVAVPLAMVEVRLLGGALSRTPLVPNAVGGRDAAYGLFVVSAPVPELLAEVIPAVIGSVFAALQPWQTGRVQANFHGSANRPEELENAWPEAVRNRLRAIRHQYDPQNTFGLPDSAR